MKPASHIIILILAILTSMASAHAAINPRLYQERASEHLQISVVEQSVTDKVTIVRAKVLKVLKVNGGNKAKVDETIFIRWTDPGKVSRPGPACPQSASSPPCDPQRTGPQQLSYPSPPAVGTTVPAHLGFTCEGASDCFYWPAAGQYSFEDMY